MYDDSMAEFEGGRWYAAPVDFFMRSSLLIGKGPRSGPVQI
jgi:hypothetical protein